MKIKFLNGWIFCAAFLLLSCNFSENDNTAGGKTVSSSMGSKSSQKTADCLSKFDHDYSKLLTKEDVLKHISIGNPDVLETKYDAESVKRHPEYGEIYYEWPSDRPDVKIIASSPVKHPDMNSVSLTNLDFSDGDIANIQDRFHTAYKVMTSEEIDAGMARMEKFYKDKPAKELENAKKLLKKRGESKNKPVEGVGDYAYWFPAKAMNLYLGSKIVVLTGNAQFAVVAKVSENDAENFEVAKKIALEVLAKCK